MPILVLAGLEPLAYALLALLALVAIAAAVKLVAGMLPDWHIPGFSALRSWVLGRVNGAYQYIAKYMGALVGILGNFAAYPVIAIEALISGIHAALAAAAQSISWLVHHGIPQAIHALHTILAHSISLARHYAGGLVSALRHSLTHLIDLARAYAYGLVHDLHKLLAASISLARHYAGQLVGDLRKIVAADYAAAKSYAYGIAHAVHTEVNADIDQLGRSVKADVSNLTKYVDTAVAGIVTTTTTAAVAAAGALVTDLDHGAAAIVDVVWPDVVTGVKGLEGVIGTDLDDIMAGLRNVDLTKPASIAAALAGVTALTIPMLRYMEQCGVPNCRNLSHYGRLIHELSGIVSNGALMALFIGLAADPHGVAADLKDFLGPIVDDTASGARTLFGVG